MLGPYRLPFPLQRTGAVPVTISALEIVLEGLPNGDQSNFWGS